MKLLLDMNIPWRYASLLASKNCQATHWEEVGNPTAPDNEIMDYARKNNYIVLTFDLDFGTILATTHNAKPSVMQIRASAPNAAKTVELIITALNRYENELKAGAIATIETKKLRVRLLPL